MKFGGLALANPRNQELIANIINRVKGKSIVVCSAMGREGFPYSTSSLEKLLVNDVTDKEKDRLLSCGEIISTIRLRSVLSAYHDKVCALSVNEIGINCDNNYGNGNVVNVDPKRIIALLNDYDVLLIPGFIGLSFDREIITLGRGNSDLTAVLMAIGLSMAEIILYKDVDGIYHASFNQYQQYYKYEYLSYDEMISLANIGFGVVSKDALIKAKEYQVKILVQSFKDNHKGTLISNKPSNDICLGFNIKDRVVRIATFYPCLIKEYVDKIFSENHIFAKNEIINDTSYSFEISKSVHNIVKKLLLGCLTLEKDDFK